MIITASHSFAQAHFEVIDGLRYLIDENAKEAALLPKTDEKYAGDVVVPEYVTTSDGKKCSVTTFADFCFMDCGDLKSVSIPSSVTSLGESCFRGCSSLTSITIPSSVTSLGGGCFNSCNYPLIIIITTYN